MSYSSIIPVMILWQLGKEIGKEHVIMNLSGLLMLAIVYISINKHLSEDVS
jgi:hypothetical protein